MPVFWNASDMERVEQPAAEDHHEEQRNDDLTPGHMGRPIGLL